jgi:hypothetical protein
MNQSVATSSSSRTSAADFLGASEVLSPEKSLSFRMRRDVLRASNPFDLANRVWRIARPCIHHFAPVGARVTGTISPFFECSRALRTHRAPPSGSVPGSDGCHGVGRASLH